jgi:hypothetical protein
MRAPDTDLESPTTSQKDRLRKLARLMRSRGYVRDRFGFWVQGGWRDDGSVVQDAGDIED